MTSSQPVGHAPLLGQDFPLPLGSPFTARQAASAGISRSTLGRLHRFGYIRRVLKGVYVATQVPDDLATRVAALALVVPPGAVVVDWTATWLYTGLLPPGAHLSVPPVSMFLPAGRGRVRQQLCVSGERTFRSGDLAAVGSLVVTTPLRTAWDMGRLCSRDTAIAALDALLRHGEFTPAALLSGVERFARQRGVVQLRALAPLADNRSESYGESVLRLRWLDMTELPPPRPQQPILDGRGTPVYFVDLGVEELRFAAEYDGEEFHSTATDLAHDARRRAWIATERGWIIRPVRRENVFGARRDVETILFQGVLEARRRLGRSPS